MKPSKTTHSAKDYIRIGIITGMKLQMVQFCFPIELEYETVSRVKIEDWLIRTEYPLVKLTNRKTKKVYFIPFSNVSCMIQG